MVSALGASLFGSVSVLVTGLVQNGLEPGPWLCAYGTASSPQVSASPTSQEREQLALAILRVWKGTRFSG